MASMTSTEIEQERRYSSDVFKMENNIGDNYVPVPQFFTGRSIFITGGTGFMGKVMFFFDF